MIVIANCANAQGLSKYGKISTDAATSVNKNGVIGSSIANNQNGKQVTIYEQVTSTTGKIWMDRNLGATRVATSNTDYLAYGSLYQWGRGSDGHQLIDYINDFVGDPVNGTTLTLSTSDTPNDALFIMPSASPFDWRSGQNASLWQGVNGINNPCPSGYRIPTEIELNAERLAFSTMDDAGAFASPHKLPIPGYRHLSDGTMNGTSSFGYYWSSTVNGAEVQVLYFRIGFAGMIAADRAFGLSVRCIKN